jgi:polar amino acid transport system substrate-binding protein
MRSWRRFAAVGMAALFIVGACSSAATQAPTQAPTAAPATAAPVTPAPATPAPATPAPATTAPTAAPTEAPTAAPTAAGPVAPDRIKSAGKLVFCTDVSFPPEEFYGADGSTAQGSDVDIANEIGKLWGVKIEIDNTGFDGIIPALKASKCDLVISGMTVTPERSKEVDFAPYLSVGQGLMVIGGNPKGIKSLDDLSGKAVAVQLATTNAATIEAENTKLKAAGKAPIDISTFQADTDAFQQLSLGRVDAYMTDAVVAAYYLSLPENKGKFEISVTVNAEPIGIAIRKDDTGMKDALTAAIDAIYAAGTMKTIVDKWGMASAVNLLK